MEIYIYIQTHHTDAHALGISEDPSLPQSLSNIVGMPRATRESVSSVAQEWGRSPKLVICIEEHDSKP